MNTDVKNLRAFEVTYLGPTNSRGSRVKIKDLRHKRTKIVGYDHEFNNTAEVAIHYLKSIGIDITFTAEGNDSYLLMTTNFEPMKGK